MKRLGELLIERGLISKEKLAASLLEQTVTKERLGKVLVRNGFLRQDTLIELLREIDPNSLHDESVFQNLVPSDVLLETRSMITATSQHTIYVSTLASHHRVSARLLPYIGSMNLQFTPANPVRIHEYLQGLRSDRSEPGFTWERLFHDAMRQGASDIHILPRYSSFTVMFRVDGVRKLVYEGSRDEYTTMVARVKDLGHMDMAERRRPQDGSFSMEFNGRIVNFRCVSFPTVNGEQLVVRILDPDSVNLDLEKLGISGLKTWRRAVGRPDGLCLICGPTGSGKTTTLAATVREMNFLERNILTVEDPVENLIPYAGQVNVNKVLALDFSEAVRTFMRADPDVIIVGEVRDLDTARNAIKAAETGHLVIATMHTNSILNTFGRLRDIGVQPYELRHLLRGVMVQRLLRTYCSKCGGKGCLHCSGSGYRGRTVTSEVAYFPDDLDVVAALEGKRSWQTLAQDARQKVLDGKSSAAEFERMLGITMDEALHGAEAVLDDLAEIPA